MLTTSTTSANSDHVFATAYQAPVVIPPSVPQRSETNENTSFQYRVQELHQMNADLRAQLDQACRQVHELQEIVAQKFPEVAQRREIVRRLAMNGRSSKSNLCKLLGVARSSFWYRTSNDYEAKCEVDLAAISDERLERVLCRMAMDLKNGRKITCSESLDRMEIGLKRLGLRIAASLVRQNPKLALDIFLAHRSQAELSQK